MWRLHVSRLRCHAVRSAEHFRGVGGRRPWNNDRFLETISRTWVCGVAAKPFPTLLATNKSQKKRRETGAERERDIAINVGIDLVKRRLHRSHFGSRYNSGCCGHAGLLLLGSILGE